MVVGATGVSSVAITKAAKIVGTEMALATKLGVSRQNLNYWKNASLPCEVAILISLATGGEVSIDELRPDLKPLMKKFKKLIMDDFLFDEQNKQLLVDINTIAVKSHFRSDYGDIPGLMQSIATVGLYEPIVVNRDMHLVSGERRLMALRELKQQYVPVHINENSLPVVGRVLESILHKPYTQKELKKIRRKLIEVLETDVQCYECYQYYLGCLTKLIEEK